MNTFIIYLPIKNLYLADINYTPYLNDAYKMTNKNVINLLPKQKKIDNYACYFKFTNYNKTLTECLGLRKRILHVDVVNTEAKLIYIKKELQQLNQQLNINTNQLSKFDILDIREEKTNK